jgi:predicted RNase H-like HicB family nuclease
MDKLIERVKEAIELCLEDEDDEIGENSDFVGIHRVWV